jgi:hypothetical protein
MSRAPLAILGAGLAAGGCTLMIVTVPVPRVQNLGPLNPNCVIGCSAAPTATDRQALPRAASAASAAEE